MSQSQRFAFEPKPDAFGVVDFVPQLSFTLINRDVSVEVAGLLDTGASVNVLPYYLGIELGAIWSEQTTSVTLGGNLASTEARGIIKNWSIVRKLIGMTIPILLGRTNFFQEFNVCFYTAIKQFELTQR